MGNFNAFQMMNELDDIALRVQVAAALAGVPPCIPDVRRRVAECVRAANPYGCNQYGEGWKQPHNGTSTRYVEDKDGKRRKEVTRAEIKVPDGGREPHEGGMILNNAAGEIDRDAEVKRTEGLIDGTPNTAFVAKKNVGVRWGKGVTGEQIREFNDTLEEMQEKYPGVRLIGLGSSVQRNDTWVATTGYNHTNDAHIHLNEDHASGGIHLLAETKPYRQPQDGFRRVIVGATENGCSVRDIVVHEYGHALYARAQYKDKGVARELAAVFKRAQKTGDIKGISKYANESKEEFFSESLAMRERGEKLPGYIEELLDKVAKSAIMQP